MRSLPKEWVSECDGGRAWSASETCSAASGGFVQLNRKVTGETFEVGIGREDRNRESFGDRADQKINR